MSQSNYGDVLTLSRPMFETVTVLAQPIFNLYQSATPAQTYDLEGLFHGKADEHYSADGPQTIAA